METERILPRMQIPTKSPDVSRQKKVPGHQVLTTVGVQCSAAVLKGVWGRMNSVEQIY